MNKCLIAPILIALVAGFAASAPAISISGTLTGDSTLTPTGTPGIFTQNFTGAGDDTTFGSFTPSSTSTIDFSKPPAIGISSGMFSEVFTQGTLFGTSSGDGTASGTGTATVTVDYVFTGGTGLFTGATGEATVTGNIATTSPTTESFSGTYVGTLNVPEATTTLALLAPTVLGLFLARRRTNLRTA